MSKTDKDMLCGESQQNFSESDVLRWPSTQSVNSDSRCGTNISTPLNAVWPRRNLSIGEPTLIFSFRLCGTWLV